MTAVKNRSSVEMTAQLFFLRLSADRSQFGIIAAAHGSGAGNTPERCGRTAVRRTGSWRD